MIPDNLVLVSAQPHDIYFAWQVEVQACNFKKFGLTNRMHVLVWYPDNEKRKLLGEPIEEVDLKIWFNISRKYPEIKFSFYKDKGLTVEEFELYIPQLRPQILAKHFDANPELSQKVVFYHDSDIIFNFLPDLESLCNNEINWQSDTSGYLDYNYLRRKEDQGNIPTEEAIYKLCQIGNISVETFKSYANKTGGAQYILKGIDGDFWRDVERQVIEIRKAFYWGKSASTRKTKDAQGNILRTEIPAVPNIGSINHTYFPNENAGFQSWCADMWAVNMALWSRNKITDITPQLDFSWATDGVETYKRKPIFHNAGATHATPGLFLKSRWTKRSPIGGVHPVKQDSASYYYVQAIHEASKIT